MSDQRSTGTVGTPTAPFFYPLQVARSMDSKLTFALSIVALLVAAVVFILPVAAWGTPVTDIGMMSTFVVFLLFGVFGLWLARTQRAQEEAA